jgi:pyruvate kinase
MAYGSETLLKRRRTKIVATIGPSSIEPAVIERLIEAGVSVFRLNMSHGDQAGHRTAFERVRAIAGGKGNPVAILADLCGPKIRVGRFERGEIELVAGSWVTVTTRDVIGQPGQIPSQYEALAGDVRPDDRILLDDGNIELRVKSVADTEVFCTVIHGGILKDRKGMNLPGVNLSAAALTEKDRADTRFALELGVDFLALSFVRDASDVEQLRTLVAEIGHDVRIIAKIEMPEAVSDIEAILDVSDGIMVARGDLGVELPPEVVPIVQRHLVAQARARNKPTIVATQMLESMIANPRPTRAEVSDVSTAVFSGADAVMLSAETASGAYPVLAVEMMDRVARQVESHQWSEGAFGALAGHTEALPPIPLHQAVARSIAQLSRDLRVRTIVVLSHSGTTAGVVAAARPAAPVVAVTTDAGICRQMNLLWGVIPVQVEAAEFERLPDLARRLARTLGLAGEGCFLLAVAGFSAIEWESEPTTTVLRV